MAGIGFETAKKLAPDHKDYHINISGRRPDAVKEAVERLQKDGLSVEPLTLDITSEESVKAAAKAIGDKYGRLDILINNSAIATPDGGLSLEVLRAMFDTNVVGTARVTDAFLPLLKKSIKTKRIVFVSSFLGSLALKMDPGNVYRRAVLRAYRISKAALNMLALDYVVEYEDDKSWKINVAEPGNYCSTALNGFRGNEDPALGAIASCAFAELGPDGETGKFKSDTETLPWLR